MFGTEGPCRSNPPFAPGFWRGFCCNPQRWQGPEIIHGTEKEQTFENYFCQSLGDVCSVHLDFLFGCRSFWIITTIFCWVLVVYSSIQKSWLAISGVIKLPILGESNNTNLWQFWVLSLTTMHCSGWWCNAPCIWNNGWCDDHAAPSWIFVSFL